MEEAGIKCSKEEYLQWFMRNWVGGPLVPLQHLVDGALCIPAVLKMGDPRVYSSLACLGIMNEMGFEIQDVIKTLYFFTPAEVPSFVLFLIFIHHSLTTCLGLPTILCYRSLSTLHWLCFDLQGAAAVSTFIYGYTKILDVTKRGALKQFLILSWISFLVMLIARFFHWVYLVGEFIFVWYNDKAWAFLVVGTLFLLIFSYFNFAIVLKSMYGRLQKFMKMSAEHDSLPSDATEKTRSQSVRNLNLAATQVLNRNDVFNDELFPQSVRKNQIDVTKSMPPRAFHKVSMTRGATSLLLNQSGSSRQFFDFLAELDRERKEKDK
mmetsp:Transcript_1157/g.1891  ORF Transcript_1157/g.1891 Transcript_1157/m.1891 type:complete len:322 (+) Transcript_1157:996-1961(+)